MSFGLCNATAIFQRMMDTTFAGLKWVVCLVYLDDVLVWSANWEEHLRRSELVLQRARERNLCLKAVKSFVGFTELTCLGHTVNAHGRVPDVKKTVPELQVRAGDLPGHDRLLRRVHSELRDDRVPA